MQDYEIKDYSIFEDAKNTTQKFYDSAEALRTVAEASKATVDNEALFKGPAAKACSELLDGLIKKINSSMDNYTKMASLLNTIVTNYQNGDEAANKALLMPSSVSGFASSPKSVLTIPSDLQQRGYTVTCYEADGWHLGGSSSPTGIAPGTLQEKVHDKWNEQGSNYTHDIATMNVNGLNCYLVATTEEVGKVTDLINVKLKNGESFPAVVADQKSKNDPNYTIYGHDGKGGVNVIEFEVNTSKYNSSGNPNTEGWGLDWDSSSDVQEIENYGSIIA